MPQLTLKIDVKEPSGVEEVILYINAQTLCALEEDLTLINGWEWIRNG